MQGREAASAPSRHADAVRSGWCRAGSPGRRPLIGSSPKTSSCILLKSKQAERDETASGCDCNVLAALELVADGRRVNRRARLKIPKRFSGGRVERKQIAFA